MSDELVEYFNIADQKMETIICWSNVESITKVVEVIKLNHWEINFMVM